jgi:hypothetical protein
VLEREVWKSSYKRKNLKCGSFVHFLDIMKMVEQLYFQ